MVEKVGGGEQLLFSECFETSSKLSFEERLFLIGTHTEELLSEHAPEALAIEKLFFNTNQKTALQVSEARGVMIYEALRQKVPIFEYTPLQIKIAITGYGRGDKSQVTHMVQKLIKIEKHVRHDDEFDAIAIALTHLASHKTSV